MAAYPRLGLLAPVALSEGSPLVLLPVWALDLVWPLDYPDLGFRFGQGSSMPADFGFRLGRYSLLARFGVQGQQ